MDCIPKVSIVCPCYGVAPFVRSAIKSILQQSLFDWELVLVDDGSPDDVRTPVLDFLNDDERIRYVRKENGGVASARNYGYDQTRAGSDYVIFLDGDDMLNSDALKRMANYLDRHLDVGMVHCAAEIIDEEGNLSEQELPVRRWSFGPREIPPEEPLTPFESIYTLSFIIPSLCMLRRSIFEKAGRYDEKFGHNMEDTDLNLRMALIAPVHFMPEKLARYRVRKGQASSNQASLQSQSVKLWKKWRTNSSLSGEQGELVQRVECFRTGELAVEQGFREARRYLAKRQWNKALRFWQGAMRRRIQSQLTTNSFWKCSSQRILPR